MKKNHYIYFVVFDQFELLDLAGPSSVFQQANLLPKTKQYKVEVLSRSGGLVYSNSGVSIHTKPLKSLKKNFDTLIIVGGEAEEIVTQLADTTLAKWIKQVARKTDRLCSICTGAFILANTGVLDGKKVTTHWQGELPFKQMFPAVNLECNRIFSQDGRFWTSAGVTAGIDLALGMIEADISRELRIQIAKRLVVPSYRAGHQSQFSETLMIQSEGEEIYLKFSEWLELRLSAKIGVSEMAAFFHMSERTFFRMFKAKFKVGPAEYLCRLRMDRAKHLLESGVPVKLVKDKVGFKSEAAFRNSFKNVFGVAPSSFRFHP